MRQNLRHTPQKKITNHQKPELSLAPIAANLTNKQVRTCRHSTETVRLLQVVSVTLISLITALLTCRLTTFRHLLMNNGNYPVPVAQLDRAPDYESGGWEFESLRARHTFQN